MKHNNTGAFAIAFVLCIFVVLAGSATALTDTTRPMIQSVSPSNNAEDISVHESIIVTFSEPMDASSINANTFVLMQRTTPESGVYRSVPLSGTISYDGRSATFVPDEKLSPNQQYGNVFTVMVTTGATDRAGNALSQDYVWSFTSGGDEYNTGASTAQTSQSGSQSTQSPVAPVTTPSSSTAPTATTPSSFPWLTFVLVVGILAVIAAVLFMVVFATPAKKSTGVRKTRPNPFGDIHPVEKIEGIGPVYTKALQAIGIDDTKQLWNANTDVVARKINAPVMTVRSWQNMAELASITDIGPQYAELLQRSGIHSIQQLREAKPKEVLALIRSKELSLETNIQGNKIGQKAVSHWIESAQDHVYDVKNEGQTA